MACEERGRAFREKKRALAALRAEVSATHWDGVPLEQWLKRNEGRADKLSQELYRRYHPDLWSLVETDLKYEGYLRREEEQIERSRRQEEQTIPARMDFSLIPSLRLEARQKLRDYAPETLGQAARISGITPADISVLAMWIKKTAGDSDR